MDTLASIVVLLAVSGSCGGVIVGVVARTSHKLRVPFSGKLIEIGFLGDALVGAGASVGIFFLAAPLFDITLAGDKTHDEWLKLASLGVLAGLAGVKLLTSTSSYVIERIAVLHDRVEQLAKDEKVNELVRQVDSLAADNRLERFWNCWTRVSAHQNHCRSAGYPGVGVEGIPSQEEFVRDSHLF